MPGVGRVRYSDRRVMAPRGKRQKSTVYRDIARMKKMMQRSQNVGRIDLSLELEASTTAVITCLNLIAGGTDDNQRLSNKIGLISYQYRFQVPQPVSTDASQVLAWYLVYDNQTNGAFFTGADYLEASNSRSFPNWENKERFKTLRSWVRNGPTPNNTIANAEDGQSGQGYVVFKDKTTSYTGTGGAITNVITGGLFLVVLGDDAFSTGTHPTLQWQGRLVFNQ